MATLLSPMSAIPHLQHHMTGAHGQSVPSNLSHNPSDVVTQSASKRPKLSLQTSSLASSYGTLTRGVAPNTSQAAYTPTTVNTLANTWDLTIRPSPVSRTESPRPSQLSRIQNAQQPYTLSLPFGIRPILKNSPLPPGAPSVSASPRESRRKVFFPQSKQVAFRKDLEELIVTHEYTARHSDLTSSEDESSDDEQTSEPSTPNTTESVTTTSYHTSPPPCRKRKIRRDSGVCIDTQTSPPSSSPAIAHPATSDDSADIQPPSCCKRRKSQLASNPKDSVKKEGTALRSKTEAIAHEDAASLQPSNDDPGTKDVGEVCDADTGHTSSPPRVQRYAKGSTPNIPKDSEARCPKTERVTGAVALPGGNS